MPDRGDVENYTDGWNALDAHRSPASTCQLGVIVGARRVIGNLVSCSLAAYAFARLEFPLQEASGSRSCSARSCCRSTCMIVPQYIAVPAARLDQHVPAADRAEVPGHRRVLRLPDGAVHPRHPARARRGGPDRRLRAVRRIFLQVILPLMRPGAGHHRDLHLHLDLERLLQPAHLPRPTRQRTPCRVALRHVRRLQPRLDLGPDVRHVGAVAAAGPAASSSSSSAAWSRASPRPASRADGWHDPGMVVVPELPAGDRLLVRPWSS